MKIRPGDPYPLGARWDGSGTNFAIFSEPACKVELCSFDSPRRPRESARIVLHEQTDLIWHGYLPGILPGQHLLKFVRYMIRETGSSGDRAREVAGQAMSES